MALAPISRLRFLGRDGSVAAGPEEWLPGYIEVCVPPDQWTAVTVTRQDATLPLSLRQVDGRTAVLTEWPRSGAGHYRLEYAGPDGQEQALWTVQPRKLAPSEFAHLLADLESLPVAIVVALQRLGALSKVKLLEPGETTVSQELLRIQRAIRGTSSRAGLARTLQAIARDPYSILQTHSLWVPARNARRVNPTELTRAYLRGHNITAQRLPERVPDTRVEHSVDVYENRLLRSFHDEVRRRIGRLLRRLEASGQADQAAEVSELRDELRRARLDASFLDDVGLPRHLPTRLTMVLLRKPEYRAAFEGFLEFRRVLSVRIEDPAVEAPLTELPRLYETWGVINVIEAVARIGERLGYRLERETLLHRDSTGVFVQLLRDNRPALVLRHDEMRRTVRVVPQRRYGPERTGLHSASYEQRPDVAIEIREDEGPVNIVLFDPKYKLDSEEIEGAVVDARPKKIDIDKMHAYRDAIRENDERVVSYAAILYPGPAERSFGTGVAAISAVPGSATSLADRLEVIIEASLGSDGSRAVFDELAEGGKAEVQREAP